MEKVDKQEYWNQTRRAQVNYAIIQEVWKCCNKRGNIEEELYYRIGLTKNSFSRIRSGIFGNLDRLWKGRKGKLERLGLPEEIMTGHEMIEVDGISSDEWRAYLEVCYGREDDAEGGKAEGRKKRKREFEEKLDEKLREAGEKGEGPVGILWRYCTSQNGELDDARRKLQRLMESLEQISVNDMVKCSDEELAKDALELMQRKAREMDIIIQCAALIRQEGK